MKRKLPMLLVVLMLLSVVYQPVAYAAPGGLPSAERNDEEIDIDDEDVPLIELPTAFVEAMASVGENGSTVFAVDAEQILKAVESVVNGDAVRITVDVRTESGETGTVSIVMPKEPLMAVVEQTEAEVQIITDTGRMTLPNEVLASIVGKAEGDDITIVMAQKPVELGKELLAEVLSDAEDVTEERIMNGFATDVDILSGGQYLTSWNGGAIALGLFVNTNADHFEQGKGYRIIQVSADKSMTDHTGICTADARGLNVEISITHLSTFVVLAEAVEENVSVAPTSTMVASPLAATISGDSGNSGSNNMAIMWFAAAGLVLVASVAGGIMLKRRQKS